MADRFYPAKVLAACCVTVSALAAESVSLTEVPDYTWHAGCFGTATGNLVGYWDRHGLPNMYSGPTAGGVAPLTSSVASGNSGIRSLWASQAGVDGRPADKPGHIEDYWEFFIPQNNGGYIYSYESTAPDPYTLAGRPEHEPDCLGDFIGQSQRKYSDLDGECSGNIDAFAFNYWDKSGDRMTNFVPPVIEGVPVRDIQSGLREWSRYRGYDADVYSQLADFNSTIPAGKGFTFEDLKAEIDAGYPVLLILQEHDDYSRSLPGMPSANPAIHAMVAYGYYLDPDAGIQMVRYKNSWGSSGENSLARWNAADWEAFLPLRGVILYHPQPRITQVERSAGQVNIRWEGPSSVLRDDVAGTTTPVHLYVVERADSLDASFLPITEPSADLEATFSDTAGVQGFFRIKLLPPP